MSTISASTTSSTAYKVTADTTGALVLQTGATPTTAVTISSAQVVTLSQALPEASGGTGTTVGYYGFKNRILNGSMVLDQRNAGASFTPTDQTYSLDRWKCRLSQASKYTVQQNAGSVTPPSGYRNYLGVTVAAAANVTIGAGDYFAVEQILEGYNIADLDFGLSTAKAFTISFWVRSSVTGTYGGALNNSAENRPYGFTYTISLANTWEQKSITITADTAGTWLSTNGIGLYVIFNLGTGSTYGSATNGSWTAGATQFTPTGCATPITTNSATFYITGVQLEKGSTATSFDYRPYGTELALAQRYYFQYAAATASNDFQEIVTRTSLTGFDSTTYLPVTMRSTPTLVLPSGSTYGRLVGFDSAFAATAPNVTAMSVSANSSSLSAIHLAGTNVSMTFAQGQGSTSFDTNNISVGLGLSAEL